MIMYYIVAYEKLFRLSFVINNLSLAILKAQKAFVAFIVRAFDKIKRSNGV